MTRFAQLLVDGIATGAAYSLFAVGFTLVFGVNRILNLAHGAVFMAGAMIAVLLVDRSGVPFLPAMVIGMIAAGLINVLLDVVAFRQLARRQAPEFAAVIASIGAILIITNIAQRVSHTSVQRFPEGAFPGSVISVGGVQLTLIRLVIVLVSIGLAGALIVYLRSTLYGKQLRATAVSEDTSSLLGINPGAVRLQAFFISGALAGAGGVLIGVAFNNVNFGMGDLYLLYGLVAIVFGGMGSVGGALVAGIVIGIVQSFTVGYLSSQLSDAVPFILLAVMLLVRPSGLFEVFASERRVGRASA
jgi:branched-chain amino acid transport system permease protein